MVRESVVLAAVLLLLPGSAAQQGTLLPWSAVGGAQHYNAIAGNLEDVIVTPSSIDLGAVRCIEAASVDTDTTGFEDTLIPGTGQAFFYLVEYDDGARSGYGTESAPKPRDVAGGDCF